MVQNAVILAKIQVQYKSGQGELYYGLGGILPKRTTMAVSARAQWQTRQKSRNENVMHLRQVHIQKIIVMYNFELHVTLTPTTM